MEWNEQQYVVLLLMVLLGAIRLLVMFLTIDLFLIYFNFYFFWYNVWLHCSPCLGLQFLVVAG
jgi:hypothetical protein